MFFSKGKIVVDLVGEHLEAVQTCYNVYEDAMASILDGCSYDERGEFNEHLRALETAADILRHKIIRRMLDGGLLVDSRKSLMHIIEDTDKVADLAEDLISMMYQERLNVLPFMVEPIKEMNKITNEQLGLLCEAIKQVIYKYDLDTLFDLIRTIEELESRVDDIQNVLLKELFGLDIELALKLHLKHMINEVSSISDLIEDISDLIEIVMLSRKV